MNKPREFWINKNLRFVHTKKPNHNAINVREVLPTDKSPEQVIQLVCDFLRSKYNDGTHSTLYAASLIEDNKDEILK